MCREYLDWCSEYLGEYLGEYLDEYVSEYFVNIFQLCSEYLVNISIGAVNISRGAVNNFIGAVNEYFAVNTSAHLHRKNEYKHHELFTATYSLHL